ncbi:hypothetical protein Tco_1059553 [Tanacetum coccineum]
MSSGSLSAREPVVPKFDMHTFTSSMTADEVTSMVEEYAIPLDLLHCVPSSVLTMNNLPVGAIDGSSQDASESVHSVTPLNTFNPINANVEAGGSNQALQSDGHMEEEVTDASNNNDINNEKVNSPHSVSFPSRSIRCIQSIHFTRSIHLTQIGTRRFTLLMTLVLMFLLPEGQVVIPFPLRTLVDLFELIYLPRYLLFLPWA